MQEALVLLILCILCIDVPSAENRFNGTWHRLAIANMDPLFHSRMIRPAGRGRYLFETNASTQAATACGTSLRPRDLAASARPARRRVPPSVARVMGGGATRERGRPARMHFRYVPLSFSAMRRPATLPAGMAWARPRQSPDEVACRAGWRRWARPRQCGAGGTPALPGGHPLAAHRLLVLFIGPKGSVVSLSDDPPEGAGASLT